MRFRPRLITSLLAAGCLLLLSGCSGSVEGTTVAGTSATSRLTDALALVPAADNSAMVWDLAASKQRWGLAAVTSEMDENAPDVVAFRKKLVATGLGTTLLTYTALFENAGWNGYDVDTEIQPAVEGPPVTIYRLRSSLDMQQVIASFTADGMTRSGADDSPFFKSASIGAGQFGRVFLSGVTVYPALHLVVGGPQGSWTPPATEASLAGSEQVKTLTADLPAADFAAVDTGADACVGPLAVSGSSSSPEVAKKYLATLDAAGERRPLTGALVAVTSDSGGQIRTSYADAAAASADLPVRQKILTTVVSSATGAPYTDLFSAKIAADGALLRYDISETRSGTLIRAHQQRDLPWAFC